MSCVCVLRMAALTHWYTCSQRLSKPHRKQHKSTRKPKDGWQEGWAQDTHRAGHAPQKDEAAVDTRRADNVRREAAIDNGSHVGFVCAQAKLEGAKLGAPELREAARVAAYNGVVLQL
jgi:hypothetical protein